MRGGFSFPIVAAGRLKTWQLLARARAWRRRLPKHRLILRRGGPSPPLPADARLLRQAEAHAAAIASPNCAETHECPKWIALFYYRKVWIGVATALLLVRALFEDNENIYTRIL